MVCRTGKRELTGMGRGMNETGTADRRSVILIDAGVQSVRVRIESEAGERVREEEIPSNAGLNGL